MKTKAKGISYWCNTVVGQKKQFPQTPEDEANYDIADYLIKQEKEKKVA